ncbi:MAG: SDR family NAD(P)-dependent oxidoreductase, partial [Cyanobacteria bacterium P01_E01_bin.34]
DALRNQLTQVCAGAIPSESQIGHIKSTKSPKVAFLFTGQGSQSSEMGRDLFESNPVFRSTLVQCDRLLRPHLEMPLLEVLYGSATGLLNQTAYTQPALFSLEYALVQVWQSWGVRPAAVLGHSLGEYVAACVAGVFSLEAGLKLVASRGRLMHHLPATGSMLAVLAPWEQIQPYWETVSDGLTVAAFNGPSNFVFSGTTSAIDAFTELLEAADINAKPLLVSQAFHSPLMAPMVESYREVLATIDYRTPQIPIVSNVTGEEIGAEIATADYWCQHILKPVRFAEGMQVLSEMKLSALLEVGPHPVLLGMGRNCVADDSAAVLSWLPSLRQGQPDWAVMLSAAAGMYVKGLSLDWSAMSSGPRRWIDLPTYPFQRQRYWVDVPSAAELHKQATNGASEILPNTTPILQFLQQGHVEQLHQQLIDSASLSSKQAEVLPDILTMLVRQHRLQQEQSKVQDWFYNVDWHPIPVSPTNNSSKSIDASSWLILADDTGFGSTIASWLSEHQCNVYLVFAGATYQKTGESTWEVNPTNPDDFNRLFASLNRHLPETSQCNALHLWSLDAASEDLTNVSCFESFQETLWSGTLSFMKSLAQANLSIKCWWLTRGAVAHGNHLPNLLQVLIWGMGRVFAIEYPEFWGGLLDLDPLNTSPNLEFLLQQIVAHHNEDQLLLRERQFYGARLTAHSPQKSKPVSIKSSGSYWITGGLGSLGLKVGRWLVDKGARNLVLIGRRQPSEHARAAIQEMQQDKPELEIKVVQADVTSEDDLKALLTTSSPVNGVFHAAGVVEYRTIADMSKQDFARIIRPKVLGGWLLHQIFLDIPLDIFVSFSSIAAVWGSKGQMHYAAANYFLDALTHYRHQMGLPALSINWGPWADGGMASTNIDRGSWSGKEMTQSQAKDLLNQMGIRLLSSQLAISALEVALGSESIQTVVADVNWQRFKPLYEAREYRPFLREILAEETPKMATRDQRGEVSQSKFREQLERAPSKERFSLLVEYLQTKVAHVLGKSSAETINSQQGFFDMGMDSLMAVELKAQLESDLGCFLPGTLTFETPTIDDMANYLSSHVFHWQDKEITAVEASDRSSSETELSFDISQITPEDLEDSLEQELSELEALLGTKKVGE